MATRVMIMAGGTGGHVFPALAVAEELRKRGCEVSWLGVPGGFEARIVPQYNFSLDWVSAYRLRGQGLAGLLLAPFRLFRAMFQAWVVMRRRQPQVVLGMGGFVTGPGGLVSRMLGRPLVIHEQNAIPGLTNKWLARVATRVLAAFDGSFDTQFNARVTGNPVRTAITELAGPAVRWTTHHGQCRLLVLGGSLGAAALNEKVPEALSLIDAERRPMVRHQAGREKTRTTQQAYLAAGVSADVSDFLHDMAEAYGWADLVVCRAGALTVSELAAAGVGSVLVPYPYAVDDHQTRNAEYLAKNGAAHLIQQSKLTASGLAELLGELFSERDSLLQMAVAARRLALPSAAAEVADICLEVAA